MTRLTQREDNNDASNKVRGSNPGENGSFRNLSKNQNSGNSRRDKRLRGTGIGYTSKWYANDYEALKGLGSYRKKPEGYKLVHFVKLDGSGFGSPKMIRHTLYHFGIAPWKLCHLIPIYGGKTLEVVYDSRKASLADMLFKTKKMELVPTITRYTDSGKELNSEDQEFNSLVNGVINRTENVMVRNAAQRGFVKKWKSLLDDLEREEKCSLVRELFLNEMDEEGKCKEGVVLEEVRRR